MIRFEFADDISVVNTHKRYSKDGNGYISTSELKFVLTRLGINLSNDDLQEMVIEADINGDSMITFEEFRDIFFEG